LTHNTIIISHFQLSIKYFQKYLVDFSTMTTLSK
jgi:hypothetical protein